MSRTRKPCPGCGERVWDREKDKVCSGCQKILDEYGDMVNRVRKPARGLAKVALPWAPHALPYIPNASDYFAKIEHGRDFQRAFFELAGLLAKDSTGEHVDKAEWLVPVREASQDKVITMPHEVVAELRKLYDATIGISEQAYREGHRDGRNIVTGLCTGSLSVKDLEEDVLRIEKE